MTELKFNKELENQNIDKLIIEEKGNIKPDIINTPDYSYWDSQEQLNAEFQIRNINFYATAIQRLASIWTWEQEFIVWFKPKFIEILAYKKNATEQTYSIGTSTKWVGSCMYTYSTKTQDNNDTKILDINYTNEWWGRTTAELVRMTRWWFVLNFTNSWEDIQMNIKCF